MDLSGNHVIKVDDALRVWEALWNLSFSELELQLRDLATLQSSLGDARQAVGTEACLFIIGNIKRRFATKDTDYSKLAPYEFRKRALGQSKARMRFIAVAKNGSEQELNLRVPHK